MNYRLSMIGIILAVAAVSGSSYAQDLTPEQQGQLVAVGTEFTQKGAQIEGLLRGKMTELALELKREGRLEDQAAAKESSKRVNTILKDISGLYGQFIKTKVEFVLAAKNVLTTEQKLQMLSQLKPQKTLPYESAEYMQPEIFELPLNLSLNQRKQLVSLEAALLIKEVELERDVDLTLLDLEAVLLSATCSPKQVDPLVMKLATLAGREIDNRVNYFLKAKDVLTLDQKRLLVFMLGLD